MIGGDERNTKDVETADEVGMEDEDTYKELPARLWLSVKLTSFLLKASPSLF